MFWEFVVLQQRHWPQHMSTCAQNTQQGGEGSAREGDLLQQSKPQTSGGSSSNKSMSSQQHQVWPFILCFRVFIHLLTVGKAIDFHILAS
jgi:hypothetical protein